MTCGTLVMHLTEPWIDVSIDKASPLHMPMAKKVGLE
jgi:hypothetical protein